ncbi:metal-dependent hydrolase family protein [Vibrio parahaemolyticus]|uniref:metal-dependent hydrolase family protein n=1 Tax=Vibrio parahaemolyticus TaxID=670 RepID=UPI001B81CBFD|nr:amidohydrolase family protein [Vibrio parahaemolyticus]MDF4723046.1 amidohydrolase family protein [Vibrio parahaemolyticus]MDF5021673.1 amidohydrolase family protein [Vibrio parahaemolyticus]MDF5041119.1 amidohydrolase family protein [Vibrio parahaemolyticus]MDF5157126.1 amidohydrolase family protein [Vibrio parahaemolyticus]MDF5161205.1 amidohydrolase family protein [Vibrio parahaemolyticus]
MRTKNSSRFKGYVLAAAMALVLGSTAASAVEKDSKLQTTLFTNVHVFDGKNEERIMNANVLVEDNLIKEISTKPITAYDAVVIDGGGRTLMPGMIDAHWHTMLAGVNAVEAFTQFDGYLQIVASKEAEDTLLRGFTTVRDVGGNSFSLKKLVDAGRTEGPRIYPSGMAIGQTSGHSDTRGYADVPAGNSALLNNFERSGHFIVADGVPQVLQRVRESLRMGASQIKIMAGGGTTTQFDPIDSKQYTMAELKAAVEAAEAWNTYVGVHVYTSEGIRRAIEAGVKVLEHGHMADEQTIKLIKEKGVWLNMQPFVADPSLEKLSDNPVTRAKQEVMEKGTEGVYKLAKKHGVKLAWGTDILLQPDAAKKHGNYVAIMEKWFTPYEVLKMVTHDNGQLCKLSGPRDPYQKGELGVIQGGAYADMILVDGNPLENLKLVTDPSKNFVVIMKDGRIYKNTLK